MGKLILLFSLGISLLAGSREQKLVDRFIRAQRKVEAAVDRARVAQADLKAYCWAQGKVDGNKPNGLFGCAVLQPQSGPARGGKAPEPPKESQ